MEFFTIILRFVWKHIIPQKTQNMLEKKNKPGGITSFDFKPYYEATVIKIVWSWHIDT